MNADRSVPIQLSSAEVLHQRPAMISAGLGLRVCATVIMKTSTNSQPVATVAANLNKRVSGRAEEIPNSSSNSRLAASA